MRHTTRRARGLIHFQRIDQPVRIRKRTGIISNIVFAAGSESGAFLRGREDGAGPVAAEGCVEDLDLWLVTGEGRGGKDVRSVGF